MRLKYSKQDVVYHIDTEIRKALDRSIKTQFMEDHHIEVISKLNYIMREAIISDFVQLLEDAYSDEDAERDILTLDKVIRELKV